jgi:opacity protein-like surface antigen
MFFTPLPKAGAQLFYAGVRGGAAIPTGSFSETGQGSSSDALLRAAKPGLGYGVDAGVGLGPIGLYAGADRIDFECETASCAASGKYRLKGASAGLRLGVPLFPVIKPWVKAGVTMNKLTGSYGEPGSRNEVVTERKPGYEVGAGIDVPVMGIFSVTSQARYVSQKLKYQVPVLSTPARPAKDVSYYTFDIGFRLRSPI